MPPQPQQPGTDGLTLQRLEDLRHGHIDLAARIERLDAKIDTVRADLDRKIERVRIDLNHKIESTRNWSLGLLLPAILRLLAKLLIPTA